MASVVHVEHGDGTHSIGVELEGVYVPFASVSAARVAHLQDRAHDLNKRLETGTDQAAVDANASLPVSAKSAGKSKASDG